MSEREVYGGAWGAELTADNSRDGFVDDGNIAWPERVTQASRQWPQVPAEDFERVGRRRWRDKASGLLYRQSDGAPLHSIGTDATRFISAFFVSLDGRIVFLERADIPEGTVVHHGRSTSCSKRRDCGRPAGGEVTDSLGALRAVNHRLLCGGALRETRRGAEVSPQMPPRPTTRGAAPCRRSEATVPRGVPHARRKARAADVCLPTAPLG
jgi:hypothetical protein